MGRKNMVKVNRDNEMRNKFSVKQRKEEKIRNTMKVYGSDIPP
jgi:hypothetical protein